MTTSLKTDRATAIVAIALVFLAHPLAPAIIVVDGSCSLGAAITAANTDSPAGGCNAGAGADEIRLAANVTLTSALPEIASDVTLQGGDFSVARESTAPDFGIFRVTSGSFALYNTTVANGRASTGGAIYSHDRPVSITGSTLTGNEATSGGGAVFVRDYGGLVTMTDSLVEGNSASNGGAIFAGYGSSSFISNSTLADNSVTTRGGAVYATDYAFVQLTNSTISGNTAGIRGGGVYTVVYGSVRLVNSTVSGNSNWNLYAGFKASFQSIYVDRSIVAYPNGGVNCSFYGGYIVGGEYNFDDDASCPYAAPITPGVDFDTTLADNGGPTPTLALLNGSVAADAAGDCGLATDQRGFARADGACDSGSFELGASPAFALAITGDCPGEITLELTTAPDSDVRLFAGPGLGTSFVPSGRCAGTELDLQLAREWRRLRTDENGEASLTRTVTSSWCGRHLQALDRSCATSNVAAFPE